MFKHILIPTDGSTLANKAAKAGIRLAKEMGARVTGYYAMEIVSPQVYADAYVIDARTLAELDRSARQFGEKQLEAIARAAKAAGLKFEAVCQKAGTPYEGIARTARRKKCDLIVMGSHGRTGLSRLVMGSVTQRVLAESKIPVLVYR